MRDKRSEFEKSLSGVQRVALELLWWFCRLFAWLPRFIRYGIFMPLIYIILTLVGYRKRVVMENLSRSFPEKSRWQLRVIRWKFYRHLAEVMIGTISLAGITRWRGRFLVKWMIPKRDTPQYDEVVREMQGRDWIAMASHYGNWEYYPLWCWVDHTRDFMAIYHRLHNPVFEAFFLRLRNYADSVKCVQMHDCVRYYLRRDKERNVAIGLISDQNPTYHKGMYWFNFLNQPTLFFDGGEKIATKFHLPVNFVYVRRRKWGRYHIWFEQIYDGYEEVAPNEIMARYVKRLEEMIRERPELWMWSHRRWKHRPSEEELREYKERNHLV